MMILIDSGLKTSVGSSLKLLSLNDALLLFLSLYYRGVTHDFLENELHTKGYLPLLTKQATKTFYIAVYNVLIDL